MYLIFDTETTGFAQFQQPPDHPAQARICQLGCLLLDEQFAEINSFCSLIKPDGWEVSSGASAANGISTQMCHDYGIPIGAAINVLEGFYEKANKAVAHNIKFDAFLVDVEFALMGGYNPFAWSQKGYCTMLESTPVCKIPKKNNGGYKWPKLEEVYEFYYGVKPTISHDALADARTTALVLKKLIGGVA